MLGLKLNYVSKRGHCCIPIFPLCLWNSSQNILSIHWKMCILSRNEYLKAFRFQSLYLFLKWSPGYPSLTLRPTQNGRHFADDISKWIFPNENFWILNNISLKFVPLVLSDNIATLVQIMVWRHTGDKPSCWFSLLTHIYIIRPQWVNSMPTQYLPQNRFINNNITWCNIQRLFFKIIILL